MKNTILVTGAAGFIGYHLINNINKKFKNKITIIGIDNIMLLMVQLAMVQFLKK